MSITSEVFNIDCIEGMKKYPDKYFDLAIVDPPYGIKRDGHHQDKKPTNGGRKNFEFKGWDNAIPTAEYWDELYRVSKNQIVWGANYMTEFLKPSRCWISWYKMQEFSTNEFELAWTSFDETCKQFNLSRVQAYAGSNKIHPTEKPIKLYDWCLNKFAKEGDLILDTHLGSGSSRIACYNRGFDFTGFEIDPDYFRDADKLFRNHIKQQKLF